MSLAELWLLERMTVRRWLLAVIAVAVIASLASWVAVAAIRAGDPDDTAISPPGGSTEQRPTSLSIAVNVGSVGILDGRASVGLEVYPTRLPIESTVTIRTLAANAIPRQIELRDREARDFSAALGDAVRRHDADQDVHVGAVTIHAAEVSPGEFHYDLRGVGTMRLDVDGIADLRRMLDRAEAERQWLVPRTVPLRSPNFDAGESVGGPRSPAPPSGARPPQPTGGGPAPADGTKPLMR